MSTFLSEEELVELTNKKRRPSQVCVLRFMGIAHKIRPDGSIAVMRAHAEREFCATEPTTRARRKTEPDFSKVA